MVENAPAQNPLELEMWRADDLRRQGKWLYAVQRYLSVIEDYPRHIPAYLALAHIYMDRKQWRAARDLLHRGLLLVPGDPLLNLHLGNVYLAQEELDRALRCYRATLRTEPDHAAGLYNLGLTLLRQGRTAEAITALTSLAARRPDYPGLVELLGSTYLGVGRPDRALDVMLPAEVRTPGRSRLLYLIGQAFSTQQRWKEAAVRLRQACLLSPDDAEVIRSYGWVLVMLGQADEGMGWLRRAIETDPTLVYAHLNLAAAYHERGQRNEARAALEAASRIDPDNPWVGSYRREWGYATASGDGSFEGSHGSRGEDRGDAYR